MSAISLIGASLLQILVLLPAATSQDYMPASELPAVPLRLLSSVTVDSAPGLSYAVPMQCGPKNSILVRFPDAPQGEELVAISMDGTVVKFRPDPMGEAAKAVPISTFSSEGRVFVLYFSADPAVTPKALIPSDGRSSEVPKTNRFYIGEFAQNGEMSHMVKLDLPFSPTRLGAFPSGVLVLAGYSPSREPKLALLKSDGQIDRYLHIEDYAGTIAQGGQGRQLNMARAEIASDGQKLIMFQRRSRGPVIEIAANGEVRLVKLANLPKEFTIASIKPADGRWVITVARTSDRHQYEMRTFAFSPDEGALTAEYAFNAPIGLGLACVSRGEFIALQTDPKTYRPVITRWAAQ